MTRSRVSFAHVISFGSSSARRTGRVGTGARGEGGRRRHAPCIILVTVAFGSERSSSEGMPPASWSDMAAVGRANVQRVVDMRLCVRGPQRRRVGRRAGAGGGPLARSATGLYMRVRRWDSTVRQRTRSFCAPARGFARRVPRVLYSSPTSQSSLASPDFCRPIMSAVRIS